MDSIQISDGYLIGHLRLLRLRLQELIEHPRLLTSDDLFYLVKYIDAVEDRWQDVETALLGGSGYGRDRAGSSEEPPPEQAGTEP